jgi:hypothetical protein
MTDHNLFNEMLATYPAEKRELAKEVFHRFADGDSSNFFTQLFLVLDVYAHYADHIPNTVIEANRNVMQTIQDVREEIEMLAKSIEQRDVSIGNHAETTDELCKITIAKCNETISKIELMLKNLGSQVDTKGIVQRLESIIQASINRDVLEPFLQRTEELAKQVVPTLQKVQEASAEASRSWGRQIWKTALTAGAIVGLSIAVLGIGAAYWQMKHHFTQTLADEIRSEKYTLQNNKDAFQILADANVPVFVARSSDSDGNTIPSGYCLYIPNAQSADMKDGNGRIFFVSPRPDSELKQLLDIQQQQ